MPLITKPHKILDQIARPIMDTSEAQFTYEVISEAIMYDCTWGSCAGLAAPQAMLSKRAFIALGQYFVNPTIIWHGDKSRLFYEGCYSLKPNKTDYPVRRWEEIDLAYQDINLAHHVESFTGKMAQVIQHELDHLDGYCLDNPRELK